MSEAPKLTIEAVVEPVERGWVIAAADQLGECLRQADGGLPWPIHLRFRPPDTEVETETTTSAVILSLLPETHRLDEPFSQVEARWRLKLERLVAFAAPTFVCTVFRQVTERSRNGNASPLLERIRRLNRMAVELSHDFGVAVIDIDRDFAHIGARVLQADYRPTSGLAVEVAGHAGAWSLLSFGLDEVIDPDLQERAKALLGDLKGIDALLARRLARRKALQAAGATARG